jgi:hypothetical protein
MKNQFSKGVALTAVILFYIMPIFVGYILTQYIGNEYVSDMFLGYTEFKRTPVLRIVFIAMISVVYIYGIDILNLLICKKYNDIGKRLGYYIILVSAGGISLAVMSKTPYVGLLFYLWSSLMNIIISLSIFMLGRKLPILATNLNWMLFSLVIETVFFYKNAYDIDGIVYTLGYLISFLYILVGGVLGVVEKHTDDNS